MKTGLVITTIYRLEIRGQSWGELVLGNETDMWVMTRDNHEIF